MNSSVNEYAAIFHSLKLIEHYNGKVCVVCCLQLLPLYFFTALGLGGAIFYTARLALRSTEVTFNKKTNPEPWNDYKDKQYTVCNLTSRHLTMVHLKGSFSSIVDMFDFKPSKSEHTTY